MLISGRLNFLHSTENSELLEATTSAIRAVVTKISLVDKSSALCLFSPTPGDVETLVDIYKAVKGKDVEKRNVKINAVRIASILAGSSHVMREGPVTLKVSRISCNPTSLPM